MDEKVVIDIGAMIAQGRMVALRQELCDLNAVDIAQAMEELQTSELLCVFRILPKDASAEVFAYLDKDVRANLVDAITDKELELLLDKLFLDDTVDFLEEVPANVVRRVLEHADDMTRALINKFLQYPDFSAGSIMTIEMVELHDTMTAKEAIDHIRKTGVDKETLYTCYCIDNQRHLIGAVHLRHLLLCDESKLVRDIMIDDEHLICVKTLDDRECVADIAKKYDLLSVPVVDNEGRLVGIITIDDIVDVIEDENTEDFEKMALLLPSEGEYLKTGVFKLARNRIVWLLILMVSATFTGAIIENFEDKLAAIIGLTAAIPMLMDTGGNAGSQVSTLVIRGLALGEIKMKDYFRLLFKELRVALICGTALAAANFIRLIAIKFITGADTSYPVFFVICTAMFCAVVVAKTIGCSLPILAKLLKLDPALMAGPMITTLVDAITLLIYFGFANLILF